MLNDLLKAFLITGGVKEAFETLKQCREMKVPYLGALLGNYFSELFPDSVGILSETASKGFDTKNFELCYDKLDQILQYKNLPEETVKQIVHNEGMCVSFISDRYVYYNPEVIAKIKQRKVRPFSLITFTITTCKRYDLFEKTINSFLNCCTDLDKIDRWLCVDDNSDIDDKEKMKKNYPFFEFYFKTKEEKGHPQSMNIIRRMVSTPYIFHMEDDWKFFVRKPYISMCLDVLAQSAQIGQCLINRNYAETEKDTNIVGGFLQKTESGMRFYVHEHCQTNQQYAEFNKKYGSAPNCAYWPHFSFRPSLLRAVLWRVLGEFNEKVSHFEQEYSQKYCLSGFSSAFLENIHCLHTGRLTSERWDTSKANAYSLNEEKQFAGKEEEIELKENPPIDLNIKTWIVNLDRRPDRWRKFCGQKEVKCLRHERFSAVDGEKLIPNGQLQRIFEGNDYNMRQGMVGCALSHIKLCIDLINSSYNAFCVLEDDLDFVPHFREKFLHLYNNLPADWDLCYLGHHLWKKFRAPEYGFYDKDALPNTEKWDVAKSFEYSMGGTGGYIISKKGAQQFLELLNRFGMTNGIDTMQQKFANMMNIYYCKPHLIYSDCWTPQEQGADTDIQKNHVSLNLDISRVIEETSKYPERLKKNDVFNIDDALLIKKPKELKIVSYGNMTHVAEAIRSVDTDKVSYEKLEYPFDTMDEGNLETFVKITERIANMSDKELEQFISHDFCNPTYNDVYVQEYNKKVIMKNKEYNISFPHEDVSKLTTIYIQRFKNLKNLIQTNTPVVLIHASRWETYPLSLFDRLIKIFKGNVKILTINGLEQSIICSDKITKDFTEFPEHLRIEEWSSEKIAFDQSRFRVDIIPIISRFLEKILS